MAFNVNQQNILTAFIVAGMVLLFLKVGLNITKVYEQRPTQKPVVRSLAPKRVLVTGAAGFIGFHLSRVLAQNKNNFIVGLDNYNDYYDVRLKIDRAYELHKLGIEVHNEDLCNVDFLEELFLKYDFTHVAHMAAQAGVRYSLENPLAYIHSNVECQMALLNVLRDFPKVKLVYASSSSVYGKESSIPFRLSAFTDRPGNMYAATKKTDELLGYYHCHAYNLSAVGLRFFTVYGPWGRPDMAVYKFGEAIVEGKKVPMFHTTDENPLGRDFTYVDDIVDGIMASLDYNPTECGERFNLGFGHPVSVPGLIKLMEEELGIPAEVEKLPLPPTEILKTWADISTSTALLEFNPKTDLKTGVSHFAKWYLDYRKLRKEQEKLNKPTDSEIWFSQKFNDTIARGQRYKDKAAEREKWRVMKRYEYEVERDPSVHDEEIVLPNIKDKKFILHKGVTFEGGDILAHYDTNGDVEKWTRMCKHNSYCIGFTTKGIQKYIAWPKSQFKQSSQSSETDGIYLADVNMCDLKLHKCHEHAECKNLGKGTYDCACNEGFIGDGMMCVPTLDVISWNTIKMDNFVEMHSIYNISEWKMETKIYFFKGVSAPGGDFLHAPKLAGNINKLIKQCSSIPICVGVSTDGYLKKKIVPRDKWLYDSKKTNEGLIVFDVNYCLLNDEGCPEHSECVHLGPGDWQCQCEESYVLKNGQCIKFPPIHSSLLPKPDTMPEGPASNVKAQLLNNRGVHTIKQ